MEGWTVPYYTSTTRSHYFRRNKQGKYQSLCLRYGIQDDQEKDLKRELGGFDEPACASCERRLGKGG